MCCQVITQRGCFASNPRPQNTEIDQREDPWLLLRSITPCRFLTAAYKSVRMKGERNTTSQSQDKDFLLPLADLIVARIAHLTAPVALPRSPNYWHTLFFQVSQLPPPTACYHICCFLFSIRQLAASFCAASEGMPCSFTRLFCFSVYLSFLPPLAPSLPPSLPPSLCIAFVLCCPVFLLLPLVL